MFTATLITADAETSRARLSVGQNQTDSLPMDVQMTFAQTIQIVLTQSALIIALIIQVGLSPASALAADPIGPSGQARPPIAIHPENPKYFLFRGRPAFLLTASEHYGSVMNRPFNYRKYLD